MLPIVAESPPPTAWICCFCSAVTARMVCRSKAGQLRLEFVQALHGIIPALFECRCYQAIARIDRFITSLR